MPFQKFTNVLWDRLLTRAAPFSATTVREWFDWKTCT